MQHGEEIHHDYIVAPFACWWLYVPEALHVFAGQGAILFTIAVGQSKGAHGIGSCHTLGIVACRFGAVKVELSAVESLALAEQSRVENRLLDVAAFACCMFPLIASSMPVSTMAEILMYFFILIFLGPKDTKKRQQYRSWHK